MESAGEFWERDGMNSKRMWMKAWKCRAGIGREFRDGRRRAEVSDGMELVTGHGTANGNLGKGKSVDAGDRGGLVGEVGKITMVDWRILGRCWEGGRKSTSRLAEVEIGGYGMGKVGIGEEKKLR